MAVRGQDGGADESGTITRRLATELRLSEATFEPDTDTGLVRAGYAPLTTLVGVAEAWPNDPTRRCRR